MEAVENGLTMKGIVKEIVPAGIIIDLGGGIEGFMPGSLVDVRYIPDFQQFMGQEFSFKVIELNKDRIRSSSPESRCSKKKPSNKNVKPWKN